MSTQPGSPFDELFNLPTESRQILGQLESIAPEVREIMQSLPDNLLRLVPNVAKGILDNPGEFLNGNELLNNGLDKLNSLLNVVPTDVLSSVAGINPSALSLLGGLSPLAKNISLADVAFAANPVAGSVAKVLGLGGGGGLSLGGLFGGGGGIAPKVGNLTIKVRGKIVTNTKIHRIIATPSQPGKLKYSEPKKRVVTQPIEDDTIVRGFEYAEITDLGMPEYWSD